MGGFVVAKEQILSPIAPHEVGTDVVLVEDMVRIQDYEIYDRSKGDEVTKGLATLQTLWFITQCVARRVQSLPLTELEVVTLAFGVINLVIYIIWWDKPLDVRYPIRIGPPAPDPPSVPYYMQGLVGRTKRRHSTTIPWHEAVIHKITYATEAVVEMFAGQLEGEILAKECEQVPTLWAGGLAKRSRGIAALFALFLAVSFGAIHCIAWNLAFATETEHTLWRVASITVMAVPIVFFLDALLIMKISVPKWYKDIVTFRLIIPIGTIIYTVARITLMILPFTLLRALPAVAYKDISWVKFIPHIS